MLLIVNDTGLACEAVRTRVREHPAWEFYVSHLLLDGRSNLTVELGLPFEHCRVWSGYQA